MLFAWLCLGFYVHSIFFNSHGYVSITSEGLQILTFARHVIEQWGFFSVQHPLLHGASVYNGHPWEPLTLTHFAERSISGAVSTCFHDLGLSRLGLEHQTSCGANVLTHCAIAAVRDNYTDDGLYLIVQNYFVNNVNTHNFCHYCNFLKLALKWLFIYYTSCWKHHI